MGEIMYSWLLCLVIPHPQIPANWMENNAGEII